MKRSSSILSDLIFRARALFRRPGRRTGARRRAAAASRARASKSALRAACHAEAARLAKLSLGGLEQVEEVCRDARGVSLVETTLQDVRYALRTIRKTRVLPQQPSVAGSGIGANTASSRSIDAVTLRPLPVRAPGELVGDRRSLPPDGPLGRRADGRRPVVSVVPAPRERNRYFSGCSRPAEPGVSRCAVDGGAPRGRGAAGLGQLLRRARRLGVDWPPRSRPREDARRREPRDRHQP